MPAETDKTDKIKPQQGFRSVTISHSAPNNV